MRFLYFATILIHFAFLAVAQDWPHLGDDSADDDQPDNTSKIGSYCDFKKSESESACGAKEFCDKTDKCASQVQEGAECTANYQCQTHRCNGTTCLPGFRGHDQECSPDYPCYEGFFCSMDTKRCSSPQIAGKQCYRNEECIAERCVDGKCAALRGPPNSCDDDAVCKEYRSDFICTTPGYSRGKKICALVYPGEIGSRCTDDNGCKGEYSGLVCDKGSCQTAQDAGRCKPNKSSCLSDSTCCGNHCRFLRGSGSGYCGP